MLDMKKAFELGRDIGLFSFKFKCGSSFHMKPELPFHCWKNVWLSTLTSIHRLGQFGRKSIDSMIMVVTHNGSSFLSILHCGTALLFYCKWTVQIMVIRLSRLWSLMFHTYHARYEKGLWARSRHRIIFFQI
jgi:hypothetical protein